jgi:beta-glucanase (GH16 family)
LNTSNWSYQIGDGSDTGAGAGWGNGEGEYYTNSNDTVSNGQLTISAKKQTMGNYNYTSTRIRTYQKVSTTYGYVEAKIKLPTVQGLWPAFWMLPESNYLNQYWWPISGEIDIMETKGRIANQSSSALHYSSEGTASYSHTYQTSTHTLDSIANWHVYSCLWTNAGIWFYVDGVNHLYVPESTWNSGYGSNDGAPFNAGFHIILNLAVGGQFDNYTYPPDTFTSADMAVDYVRIYAQ